MSSLSSSVVIQPRIIRNLYEASFDINTGIRIYSYMGNGIFPCLFVRANLLVNLIVGVETEEQNVVG